MHLHGASVGMGKVTKGDGSLAAGLEQIVPHPVEQHLRSRVQSESSSHSRSQLSSCSRLGHCPSLLAAGIQYIFSDFKIVLFST